MSKQVKEIQRILTEWSDKANIDFFQMIVPGKQKIYGVKTPVLNELGMQFLRGIVKTHQKQIFDLARKLNRSKDPWQRRLSLVMVEWYTRKGESHKEIKELVNNLENDKEYYVKKAVVWINRNFRKGK